MPGNSVGIQIVEAAEVPVLCIEPNGRVGITPAKEPFHLMPLTTAAVELT